MYTISIPSGTIRLDGIAIPQDDSKPQYIAYALWLAAGNGPVEIADQEQDAPRQHITVSAWQIRKALNQLGLRENVESTVSASGDITAQDGWMYATEWESDHPIIASMLPLLGMTEDQMYDIFTLASTL